MKITANENDINDVL